MKTINFKDKQYPALQAEGFASQYAFLFANTLLTGFGVDIGYGKPEWKLPKAVGIEFGKWMPDDRHEWIESDVSATNFNCDPLDYLFSSHCLEHLADWVGVLDYWGEKLKSGGVMFLYLPNADYQEYWRPMYNRKHVNWLTPHMLEAYFKGRSYTNIFVTQGYDLNGSFYAVAERV